MNVKALKVAKRLYSVQISAEKRHVTLKILVLSSRSSYPLSEGATLETFTKSRLYQVGSFTLA